MNWDALGAMGELFDLHIKGMAGQDLGALDEVKWVLPRFHGRFATSE
jgi:hypothetical protein